MESRSFPAALWSDSWGKVSRGGQECEQGIVSFDEEGSIRLDLPFGELFTDPGVTVLGGEALPSGLEWLYGFSQDGRWIALSDAKSLGSTRSYPGGSHQTVGASRILFSKDRFDPSSNIAEVTLELKGLSEWFGHSPISIKERMGDGRARKILIDVELDGKNSNKTLHDGEAYTIRISHNVTIAGSPEGGFTVGHKCVLEVGFKQALTLADAAAAASRVTDFFSFCLGFDAGIEKMTLEFEGGQKAECLVPFVKGRAPSGVYVNRMVFPYSEIAGNVDSMLGLWLAEGEAIKVPSALLVSLLHKSWLLPIDLMFVASAQMFEALCRVGADLESLSAEDFKAFKEAVMSALGAIKDKRIARMAKERIHPGNSKGQSRLIKEFVERHRAAADYVFGDSSAFARRHIYLRNALTHRDGEPDVEAADLVRHTEGVLLFAFCAVAEMLGLAPETVTRRIESSGYRNAAVHECRKLYSRKTAKCEALE